MLHPINTLSLTSRLPITTPVQTKQFTHAQTQQSPLSNKLNQRSEYVILNRRSRVSDQSQNASKAAIESPLQIEYSPCPVRTTNSLLALRRRLTDTFVPPHHSVGTLQSLTRDNPLYFTLKPELTLSKVSNGDVRKSPSGNCSDEIPIKFRRKDPKLCSNKKSRHSTSRCSASGPRRQNSIGEEQKSKESLSPLSRNLASLRLSSGSREKSILQKFPKLTPPSPFLNSTTFVSSLISANQNQRSTLGVAHDVTDPRFLSLYSMLEPTDIHIESPNMETKHIVPHETQDANHTPVGSVNRVLCFPEESPVKNLDSPKTNTECVLKKRPSLRRTRTLTSNSEDGPPVKVQPVVSASGNLVMPNSEESRGATRKQTSRRLSSPSNKAVKQRTRKSSKSLNKSAENSALKGLGDGVFTSENLICDSVFSGFSLGQDSFDGEESMLRRQGGIRRKQRTAIRNSGTSDSCLFKIPNRTKRPSGLTLPHGIPSPFSPEDASGWFQSVPCHTLGLPKVSEVSVSSQNVLCKPSSTIISRLNGTVSCSDIQERPSHFGLTLPEGIPSPPSPTNDDDDQYSSSVGMTGVQPLSSSPAVVTWRQKRSSSSSDDTWNSHNMHFMKTPRLTAGHVLNMQEADSQTKSDGADTSNGKCMVQTEAVPTCLIFVL